MGRKRKSERSTASVLVTYGKSSGSPKKTRHLRANGGATKNIGKKPYKHKNPTAQAAEPNAVDACRNWHKNHPKPSAEIYKKSIPFNDDLLFLQSVHRGPKRLQPKANKPADASYIESIQVTGQVLPNYAAFSSEKNSRRLMPTHAGIELSIDADAVDARDIYIGLDFGTSCSKVILGDAYRRDYFAVPFFEIGSGNPFLFPSRVFLSRKGIYSLDEFEANGAAATPIRDLKLTLMRDAENIRYMVHAAAYLALVIRHSRGWFLSTYHDAYRNTDITWGVNLGLPAEKSEDEYLGKRFRALALAAANLASDKKFSFISEESASFHLNVATRVLNGESPDDLGLSVWPDMVGVYPEIAAQVVAFVESERWDAEARPFITMIDIGAGTVDVSFFSVEKRKGRLFRFFKNEVAENGVMNLHRERVRWLREILEQKSCSTDQINEFLNGQYSPTDRLSGIPESVDSYLSGIDLTSVNSIDDEFFIRRYRYQVYAEVLSLVHRSRVPNGDHWLSLPVFICGGGSRMPFYRKIIENLNSATGTNWLRTQRYHLTKPANLYAAGLDGGDYDRLSVAYGLSFESVGKIIRSHEIEDFEATPLPAIDIDAPGKEVC